MPKITEITVIGLFGRYTYNINTKNNDVLLYGDNGSGKSTVLRLVYHLLCTEEGGGHKTWLANCPFTSLEVLLDDGSKISAVRDSGTIGSYRMLLRNGKINASIDMNAIYDGTEYVIRANDSDLSFTRFMIDLDQFTPSMVYLTDSRKLLYNDPPNRAEKPKLDLDDYHRAYSTEVFFESQIDHYVPGKKSSLPNDENQVIDSLRRVNSYFNKIVSQASIEGDSSVNQIYIKILNDITSTNKIHLSSINATMLLEEISSKLPDFVKYGLVPNLEVDLYMDIFKNSRGSAKTAVSKAIIPLMDSLYQRMVALKSAKDIICAFDSTINNVLLDKSVHYKYGQGIGVRCGDQLIDPMKLSSGEKQLVIILCNLICKAQNGPIIFIDEPEISLNIKWQRDFIRMLNATTKHGSCQYMLATHSMEILSQNTHIVTNLNEQRHV